MNYKFLFYLFLIGFFVMLHSCKNDSPMEAQNQPPVISNLGAEPDSVSINDTTLVTCVASDPDGDSLSFAWSVTGTGSIRETEIPNVIEFIGTIDELTDEGIITCRVSDGRGGETTGSLAVKIFRINQAPVIASLIADPDTVTLFRDSTIVTCDASDPEGTPVSFGWRLTGSGGLRSQGHQAIIVPVLPNTIMDITCIVTDGERTTSSGIEVPVTGIESSLLAEHDSVPVGETTVITYTIQDADGDTPEDAEYLWESDGPGDATIIPTAEPNVIEWRANTPGEYETKITVAGRLDVIIDERTLLIKVD